VQYHVHHAPLDRLLKWDLVVSEELEMRWGLWILLPEATEGAVDAIHRSTRIETEHYKVKRLTGAIAISSSMPVCGSISVGDSLVIPMCHAILQ
jgi:hypothetical protein